MNLQRRTEAQLLSDFRGEVEPSLKILNLIYTIFRTIESAAGLGDMAKAVYDPEGVNADAFDLANQHGILSAAFISGLADVATTGTYLDLLDLPTLGALAAKDEIAISDITATGTASSATFLRGDGSWAPPDLSGDMAVSIYDPQGIAGDAFDLSLMTGMLPAAMISGIAAVATTGSYDDLSDRPILGTAAAQNVGTTAGTVAAGNDARITGAVQTTRTITASTGLTGGGDLSANRTIALSSASSASLALADSAVQPGQIRERLTAVRTYYVSPTGSDAANGLTTGTAFATIQKAWDTIVKLDLGGYGAIIQLMDGTFSDPFTATEVPIGGGVTIRGNVSNPSATHISRSGGGNHCIVISCPAAVTVEYLKVTSSARCMSFEASARVTLGAGVIFNTASIHVRVANAYMVCKSINYTIAGSANRHLSLELGGIVEYAGASVTVTDTPAFSDAFAMLVGTSALSVFSTTFTGSATGKYYSVRQNSSINTFGAGESYFPGNTAGEKLTGGQYE